MTALTDLLASELLAARRAGDRAAVSALRTASAAIANAEAVPAPTVDGVPQVAVGVGATDVPRRVVTEEEQTAIVRTELAELREAVTVYRGRDEARADAAEAGAAALERLLARSADD